MKSTLPVGVRQSAFLRQYIRIEAVRAISVLYVLIAHIDSVFITIPNWYAVLSQYTHYGVGVIVFFVISGYVVSRSLYLRLANDDGQPGFKKKQLKTFYIRRFTRLMPLAVIWALITLAGAYFLNRVGYFGVWETNLRAFPSTIFYYANFQAFESFGTLGAFGVYWSLAVEEQFYLFIPLLLIFVSKRAAFISLFILLYLLMGLWRVQSDYLFWRALWFDGLILGVLIYLTVGDRILVSEKWIAPINILFLAYATVGFSILAEVFIKTESLYLPYASALSCLMFLWALVTFEGARGSGIPVWLERFFLFIGARAYGLYLSHFTVSMFIREFWHMIAVSDQPDWQSSLWLQIALFASWLITTLAATEFFYRVVERPLTEFGRNFGRVNATPRMDTKAENPMGAHS